MAPRHVQCGIDSWWLRPWDGGICKPGSGQSMVLWNLALPLSGLAGRELCIEQGGSREDSEMEER